MTLTYEGIRPGRTGGTDGKQTTAQLVQGFHGDENTTEYDVLIHPSAIKWGSAHPTIPFCWCNSVRADQSSNGRNEWTLTAGYSSAIELNENPLFEPAAIEWDGDNFEEPLIYDRNDDACVNSAGDLFENLFRERTRRVVTVTKNVAAIPAWIIDTEDAVNSAIFNLDGIEIGIEKAKLRPPSISRKQIRNGIQFREMKMVFTLRKDTWKVKVVDAGFRYKDGTERKRITNDDGSDVSQPVCLDGSGGVLANPTPSTIVYREFDGYPSYDFNLLPLV